MKSDTCHIQIMNEALIGDAQTISDDVFNKAYISYKTCLCLLWVEEKFNVISGNYYEWEREIHDSYNFMLENQNDCPDCSMIMQTYGIDKIIVLNRRLSNILSSIRMYRDQVLHDLSILENDLQIKNLKSQFEKETHAQYDNSLSYQLMEFIRNYIQHEGMIIERLHVMIPLFNRKVNTELLFSVETRYELIKNIDKFDQKIKAKEQLDDCIEWVNLVHLVKDYFSGICELHNRFREITDRLFIDSISDLMEILQAHYNNMHLSSVAFLRKREMSNYKDFLVQTGHLRRVQEYRKSRVARDNAVFYVSKKTYITLDDRKLQNSVNYKILYNLHA